MSGFLDSDYALTVSSGAAQVVAVEVVTLQTDVPVTGDLLQGTSAVYRANSGNSATLTSITGNAQLRIYSSDEFSLDTLICVSEEPGSALDSCQYNNSQVYISVVGATDTRYSLVVNALNSSPAAIAPGAVTTECIDTDGDGWGWDGTASCLISAPPAASVNESSLDTLPCIDADGDGWGWQQPAGRPDLGQSCRVEP